MNESENFFSLLNTGNKLDIDKVLKQYYTDFVVPGALKKSEEVLPFVLFSTHVTTIVNGVNKSISIADFKNFIDSILGEHEVSIPPIALPFGCFMFNRAGEHLHINCYHKGVIANIKYDTRDSKYVQKKYKIPLPNIIISFSLKKVENGLWQVMSARYFSTPKTVIQLPDNEFINNINADLGVYKLPMSNMYSENNMCFGNNTMPVRFTNNLRGLDYYYQVLTQAPFNSDLGIRGLTQSYTPQNWYEFLNDKTEFPYDLLSKQYQGE